MENKHRIIVINKENNEKDINVMVGGFYIIVSDPDDFKGVKIYSSTNSVPRRLGWLEWAREMEKLDAGRCYNYSLEQKREKKNG